MANIELSHSAVNEIAQAVRRYRDARDIAQERFRRSLSTADSAALGLSGMRASLIDADNAALMRFRADMAVILSDAEADALVRRRKA